MPVFSPNFLVAADVRTSIHSILLALHLAHVSLPASTLTIWREEQTDLHLKCSYLWRPLLPFRQPKSTNWKGQECKGRTVCVCVCVEENVWQPELLVSWMCFCAVLLRLLALMLLFPEMSAHTQIPTTMNIVVKKKKRFAKLNTSAAKSSELPAKPFSTSTQHGTFFIIVTLTNHQTTQQWTPRCECSWNAFY